MWPVTAPSCSICVYKSSNVAGANADQHCDAECFQLLLRSPELSITTRSGSSAAIASTLGSKPDRSCGSSSASAG